MKAVQASQTSCLRSWLVSHALCILGKEAAAVGLVLRLILMGGVSLWGKISALGPLQLLYPAHSEAEGGGQAP